MRLTGSPLFVAISLFCALDGSAAARPHYGGTLHVEMRAAPTSLDPADAAQPDWSGYRNLSSLMFDTLVSLDAQGKPEPALATSWKAESGDQRWQFFLRRGVTFEDGAPVTPDAVAASLRRTNPTWKVFSEGESVVIERDSPTRGRKDFWHWALFGFPMEPREKTRADGARRVLGRSPISGCDRN